MVEFTEVSDVTEEVLLSKYIVRSTLWLGISQWEVAQGALCRFCKSRFQHCKKYLATKYQNVWALVSVASPEDALSCLEVFALEREARLMPRESSSGIPQTSKGKEKNVS